MILFCLIWINSHYTKIFLIYCYLFCVFEFEFGVMWKHDPKIKRKKMLTVWNISTQAMAVVLYKVCNIKNEINFHTTFPCCFACCFVSHFLWLWYYNLYVFGCCLDLRKFGSKFEYFCLLFCVTVFVDITLQFGCLLFWNSIFENICIYWHWRQTKVCISFVYAICWLFAEYSAKSLILLSIVLSTAKYFNAFETAISPKHIFTNKTYYHQQNVTSPANIWYKQWIKQWINWILQKNEMNSSANVHKFYYKPTN